MEMIVEEIVSPEDLQKFCTQYTKEQNHGRVTPETQFAYAWCLVRSPNKTDIQQGTALLEDLYHKTKDESAKRDYLFYLAVGHTRLKEYERALKFSKAILTVEPGNHQAQQLCEYIDKKMKKDGLIGMALIGGAAAVGVGAILAGIGIALSRK